MCVCFVISFLFSLTYVCREDLIATDRVYVKYFPAPRHHMHGGYVGYDRTLACHTRIPPSLTRRPLPPPRAPMLPRNAYFFLNYGCQLEAGLDSFAFYLTDPGHLDCAELTSSLEGSGIRCPVLDKALVGTYAATLASGRE